MSPTLTVYGAAQTVTGSRHLLTVNGKHILVDCGLFQGSEELRERNWQKFPIDPHAIDAIVITHAHQDHIGYLPRLVASGYRGPIYATPATIGLCRISLPDSGRIQEEDARFHNKHRTSRHEPALPLYTEKDAYECLKLFQPVKYYQMHDLPGGAQWRYIPAGHILGSAFVEMYFDNGERILLSGDLGRYNTPIIKDPTPIDFAEYLMIESTYGDRLHGQEDVEDHLARIFTDAMEHGRAVLVPSFAIGRTQELLYHMTILQKEGRMPRIPIFVDSPMAVSATDLYDHSDDDHDSDMKALLKEGYEPLSPANLTIVRDRNQSKEVNFRRGPMVVISGSGMANGGRIVHHLKHRLSDPSTLVVFTGYQANGTLGRKLLDGAPHVRILGDDIPVHAEVTQLTSLSAHADYGEMLQWLKNFKTPPKKTFIVHGEPPAQESLQQKIESELGWDTVIPHQGQSFRLD